MREEKTDIVAEIRKRLDASPYVIVADYTGMKVEEFNELRNRLNGAKARFTVTKNTMLRRALKELNQPSIDESLEGPTAIVYGEQDITAAAKILKNFRSEFEKPKVKIAIFERSILQKKQVEAIADLPSREVLLAQLLGVLSAPATKLVSLLNAPASQLVRVLKAQEEKLQSKS
ncbi:MAG: 50S ribosomal protein L10 [Verrucomicrobiae bacterium]|nr:50S ribosomal protein L10 [Verrucomicrobiae bacterium]